MKLRFGFDIDGVMYQWSRTARYMLREILPDSPYLREGPLGRESTYWSYIPDNVSKEHWAWLWKEGVQLGLFRHGHMYPGVIKYVKLFAELGEVIAITHRPRSAVHDTLAWLTYQNLPLSGVHILTDQQPKSTVTPQCDLYIDDKIENCNELYENTEAKVFIMDREWNQESASLHGDGELCSGAIDRAFGWRDFYEKVQAMIEAGFRHRG